MLNIEGLMIVFDGFGRKIAKKPKNCQFSIKQTVIADRTKNRWLAAFKNGWGEHPRRNHLPRRTFSFVATNPKAQVHMAAARFTIHAGRRFARNRLAIRIKQLPKLSKDEALDALKFDPSWIEVLP
jgi:hypothetical protein